MPSSRRTRDPRRQAFLSFSGQVGALMRDAYAARYSEGGFTQADLARKLGVSRSVINRRLTGRVNMTEETISDMFWALEYALKLDASDARADMSTNHRPRPEADAPISMSNKPAKVRAGTTPSHVRTQVKMLEVTASR